MSSKLPIESPKHRIEFTGKSAPKKRRKPRKPPPKWIVGWFGGLLLFVGGGALGGCAPNALVWRLLSSSDDGRVFFGIMFVLPSVAIIGASIGSCIGLAIWICLSGSAHEEEELD